MNKLTIIGNVGSDAVIKNSNGGTSFLSFDVAVNETYTNKEGEKVQNTTWYDCVFKHTNLAKYIKKGDRIYIEGTPRHSLYQNKAGETVISHNVSVKTVELLGSGEGR